jgi:hypothetical protein
VERVTVVLCLGTWFDFLFTKFSVESHMFAAINEVQALAFPCVYVVSADATILTRVAGALIRIDSAVGAFVASETATFI